MPLMFRFYELNIVYSLLLGITNDVNMQYEHKRQALASKKIFYQRVWKNAFVSFIFLTVCLLIGVVGYKVTIQEFTWYDSLLNASMILSGMGPIIDPAIQLSNTAKVFASLYALFSGVAFISTIGLIIAPIAHRFFHKLHIEDH